MGHVRQFLTEQRCERGVERMRRRHETCPGSDYLCGAITEVPNNARNQPTVTMVHGWKDLCTLASDLARPVAVDQRKTAGGLWRRDCLGASALCPVGSLDCYPPL